jgi:adenosylmethionine-8-amino-7-oxononanoate aminotransferase
MTDLRWPFLPGRNIYIERAEGVHLYTRDGQQIIDAAGGAIVANIGHGRERVAAAVASATRDYSYVVPPWMTPSREAMLEVLNKHWLPPYLRRVHCTSGGSESVEAAMKIALHYQQAIGQEQRTKIVGRSVSYHGTTLATASISGHPNRKRGLEPALTKFPEIATPYPLRCPLGTHHENAGEFYVDGVRDLVESEGPGTIAALLAEPITGSSGGAIVPPDDYWPAVREICEEHGILLILDEVMTGFGRTGTPFGFQHWPIEPDILISGKGLAGGYAPLGGVFARESVGAAIEQAGFQVMFNTFGAHPAACAAAAEVLQILVEEDLVEQAKVRGDYLLEKLNEAFEDHPHVAEVRGRGLLTAIEIVKDRESLERFALQDTVTNRVVAAGLSKGVFFYGGGTGDVRDIVCMGPPFVIEETELDTIVETLQDSVNEVIDSL